MASNHTTNFGLNQWEPGDKVLREEFNADHAKLDAVIPRIITGTYRGDGTVGRIIRLDFRPRAVLLFRESGSTCFFHSDLNYDSCFGGLLLDGHPLRMDNGYCNEVCAEIIDAGFKVTVFVSKSQFANVATNLSNIVFHYIAIG